MSRACRLIPCGAVIAGAVALAGCGGGGPGGSGGRPVLTPIGRGVAFLPSPAAASVTSRRAVRGMRCEPGAARRYGVHLELFAHRRVIIVPAGVGVAPPRRAEGRYVAGPCTYPLRTREPTGVIEVAEPGRTLGDFFAVWDRPLGPRRLLGFRGTVRAWVNGRRRIGDPRTIPLQRHAEIVLEVAGYVPPHERYGFPPPL